MAENTSALSLPTTPTLEGSKISQLKWLLYGPPGIGKSTFFSKAVDGKRMPLFLYTDPGLRFIKALKRPIMSWRGFKKYVDLLVTTQPKHVSMVVIDTADLLFRLCRREVCQARGIEHVSDEQWGKGYDMVRDEFEQEIAKLAKLSDAGGMGLAFISHSKDVEIRGRTVRTSKLVPTLPKQAHDIVTPMCDVIGYAGFTMEKADREGKDALGRVVYFEPDETVEAKDRSGLLPARCRLDFDEVRKYLEGDTAPEAEAEPEMEPEPELEPETVPKRGKK